MITAILCALRLCSTLTGPALVHDGDTLRVEGQSIRLNGVDAEELTEPNGPAARDALTAIIAGRSIVCRIKGRSYNRLVGRCFADGQDIGAELIRQGFALDCAHYSGERYRRLEPSRIRERLRQKPYC